MDDYTRKFSLAAEKDEEIHQILTAVYRALEEKRKSYDALLVTQLADAAAKERLQGEVERKGGV